MVASFSYMNIRHFLFAVLGVISEWGNAQRLRKLICRLFMN